MNAAASAIVRTSVGPARFVAYPEGRYEHAAVVFGNVAGCEDVLVRIHSRCLTGDVFGSLRCDCGPQLHAALARINEVGVGVVVYLDQEGRGIGLANKMRAYALQAAGLDTVDANVALGLPVDARDFSIGAVIVRELGVRSVRLLTNNPQKVAQLMQAGLVVTERVPLIGPINPFNARYLSTKADRLGHHNF